MGFLVTTIKWGTKLGLAGGTVYVANQYGLFGNAEQSREGWFQLKDTVHRAIPKEVLDQTPEMPTVNTKDYLPDVEIASMGQNARGYWNRGVLASFAAMANAPTALRGYGNDMINFVSEQMKATGESEESSSSSKKDVKEEDCEECKPEQKDKKTSQ